MFRRRRGVWVSLACLFCLALAPLFVRWLTRSHHRMQPQFEQVRSLRAVRDEMTIDEVGPMVGLLPGDYSTSQPAFGVRGIVRGFGTNWDEDRWTADDAEMRVYYERDTGKIIEVRVYEAKGWRISDFYDRMGRRLGL